MPVSFVWCHILSQAADPQGSFFWTRFPDIQNKMNNTSFSSCCKYWVLLQRCSDPFRLNPWISCSSLLWGYYAILCFDICSCLSGEMISQALQKTGVSVIKRISRSYLSDPLNFHGLCMDGEYFSGFALAFKDGNWVFQGFSRSLSQVLLQSQR